MEIRRDSALLAGDKIAGLKDSRDGGVWLSDDVIPCHGATYSVRERDGRTELSLEGDFIVFGVPVDWARKHHMLPLEMEAAIEMAINATKEIFASKLLQIGEQRTKNHRG